MNTALEEFRPSAVDEAAAAPSRLLLAAEAPRVVAAIDAMLASVDVLRALLGEAETGHPADPQASQAVQARLNAVLAGTDAPAPVAVANAPDACAPAPRAEAPSPVADVAWSSRTSPVAASIAVT